MVEYKSPQQIQLSYFITTYTEKEMKTYVKHNVYAG